MDQGSNGLGLFLFFAILMGLGSLGFTAWRVSTARRIARDAGMNEDDAATATLLTRNGLDATYLAASLRQASADTDSADEPSAAAREDEIPMQPSPAVRLRELQRSFNEGLVTKAEFDERRQKILAEF